MNDLTTYPIVQTAHNRRFTYAAFYILPADVKNFLDVPKGKTFGLIHTPSPYTTNKNYGKWTYTQWEVCLQQYKHDAEPSCYYRVKAERDLTNEECEYFENIVSGAILWEISKLTMLLSSGVYSGVR